MDGFGDRWPTSWPSHLLPANRCSGALTTQRTLSRRIRFHYMSSVTGNPPWTISESNRAEILLAREATTPSSPMARTTRIVGQPRIHWRVCEPQSARLELNQRGTVYPFDRVSGGGSTCG